MSDITRIHELVEILNEAARHYYSEGDEIMSNFEYDKLYDELVGLEEKTGLVLAGSPTINVGYKTLSELPKETHVAPMLSLAKTKDLGELTDWLGDKKGILSMKLDGLSIILTYEKGELTKALTRGNGEVGEVITNNAKTFKNLPHRISYNGRMVLRGEALIRYSDFEKFKGSEYKNPRNLCSGSVRQLNNEITAERCVNFYAYNIIELSEADNETPSLQTGSKEEWFNFLEKQGFQSAPHRMVTGENLLTAVKEFEQEVSTSDLPSDGLVLTYDDIAYGISLGRTAKTPRDSIALKWEDETAGTTLIDIEWSASRTGLINPVAIFEPVELEGTTVRRASVHNVSMVRQLKLGYGDKITVYKANMIIPQIASNETESDTCLPPEKCPVCEGKTELVNENGSTVLMCKNEDCYAKQIHSLAHFVSRDALNIDGLSEATLEKWIARRYIRSFADLFEIERFREEIISDDTMKIREKSFENLINSIETAKNVALPNVIYALGIRGIGLATAKDIVKTIPDISLTGFIDITREELLSVNGIGDTLAESVLNYLQDEKNREQIIRLNSILHVSKPEIPSSNAILDGKIFVITGSLETFSNRNECKDRIEALGGRVASAVSANTDFLVNNDSLSGSSKNKKAKQLGISIITENELLSMMGQ
ncbi:MAG: NAD-dependent DNA ligase LigA [Eubacterium sp.]|nr:NAD-dependent DNA ligase LigA [Eubacterium sp.]